MTAFYEDIVVGETVALGAYEFTRERIVEFARQWDPQSFHLDDEAAKTSIFGSLCASGWHTGCVAMRLFVESRQAVRARLIAQGGKPPPLGVSPGIIKMRWPIATRPGDVLTYSVEVLGKRETQRPQWGLVHQRTFAINQNGLEAISFEGYVFVGRRRT